MDLQQWVRRDLQDILTLPLPGTAAATDQLACTMAMEVRTTPST